MAIMSDVQIAAQYSDFKILSLNVEEKDTYFTGCVEIEFPNADNTTFDGYKCDNFIGYDKTGERIAFDNWYPDEVYYNLCYQINKQRKAA